MRCDDAEIELGLTWQRWSGTITTRLHRARQDLGIDALGTRQQSGRGKTDKDGARRPCSL